MREEGFPEMPKKPRVYTLGFIFADRGDSVLLIRKDRPEWQAGKLNGIGGKREKGESTIKAMSRETKEETGLEIAPEKWLFCGSFGGGADEATPEEVHPWEVHVFTAMLPTIHALAPRDAESEKPNWYSTEFLPYNDFDEVVETVPAWVAMSLMIHRNASITARIQYP